MPEPSREAREACFCIPCAKSLGKRANGSHAPDECIARALDDFAEKWREEAEGVKRDRQDIMNAIGVKLDLMDAPDGPDVWSRMGRMNSKHRNLKQERDALRKQIRDAINALNTDTVTDLTHTQDGTLRMAMQAHASGVSALRRRVGELEAEAQRFYERAVDQLARAEAAEAALDEIIDMDAYEIHEGIVDPQQVAREARRARGEGK